MAQEIDSNAVTGYSGCKTIIESYPVPTLTIRNLPEPVHNALRLQAAQDGLSVEAEVRKILTEACKLEKKSPTGLQNLVDQLYNGNKPAHVVEELIQERRSEARKE